MTRLEEIINDASGSTTPIPSLLRKVKVVAASTNSEPLSDWLEHELSGYPESAEVPPYRGPFRHPVIGHLVDRYGNQIRNTDLPTLGFPPEFRGGQLFNMLFTEPISQIASLSEAGSATLSMRWSGDMVSFINTLIDEGKVTLQGGMYVAQAEQVIPSARLQAILDAVRSRVLDLVLQMKASYPDGDPEALLLPVQPINQFVNHIYAGATANVAQGSHHFEQHLTAGTRESLFETLRAAGVDEDLLAELNKAMSADEEAGESGQRMIGPRVQGWIGGLTVKAATTAGTSALSAITGIVAKEVARFYGIG